MGDGGTIGAEAFEARIRFLDILRMRSFAVLYGAETQSIVGDQLARIALSVFVFDRTDSAAATAITYAATFLPAILGGAVLAGLGDRFRHRTVMVSCDVLRAGLFAAMAIHGMPLAAVIALLVAAVFVGPAFAASEVSYLALALDPERFRAATGLRLITNQVAQVGGFAVGGVLVAALEPRGALLVDAASYLVSAVVIGGALPYLPRSRRGRPMPGASHARSAEDNGAGTRRPSGRPTPAGRPHGTLTAPVRNVLWTQRRLRTLIGLCWLAGFFVVPEGLAVPFGKEIGATTVETGLLLASIPLGGALGAIALVRWVPKVRRETTAVWMAVAAGLPLIVSILHPMWPIVVGTWALSGAFAAYQVEVTTLIVQLIPEQRRARLVGIVGAGLIGAQGVGLVLFGLIGEAITVGAAVAVAGICGSAAAIVLRLGWRIGDLADVAPPARQHAVA